MKTKLFRGTLVVVLVLLVSCSSAMEKDAKRVAEIQFSTQKYSMRILCGDIGISDIGEAEELDNAATEMDEIEKKYASDTDKEKFNSLVVIEIAKFKPELDRLQKELEEKYPNINTLNSMNDALEGMLDSK